METSKYEVADRSCEKLSSLCQQVGGKDILTFKASRQERQVLTSKRYVFFSWSMILLLAARVTFQGTSSWASCFRCRQRAAQMLCQKELNTISSTAQGENGEGVPRVPRVPRGLQSSAFQAALQRILQRGARFEEQCCMSSSVSPGCAT